MRCEFEMESYLKKKGLKKTPERQKVLTAVNLAKGHFDIESILDIAKKNNIKISRASVYRAVPLLLDAGIITETTHKDGRRIFEFICNSGHHDHMICVKCGKIIEFYDPIIEKEQEKIAKTHKFKVIEHRLVLQGICSKCM